MTFGPSNSGRTAARVSRITGATPVSLRRTPQKLDAAPLLNGECVLSLTLAHCPVHTFARSFSHTRCSKAPLARLTQYPVSRQSVHRPQSDVRMRGFQDRMEVSRFQALVRERIVPPAGL